MGHIISNATLRAALGSFDKPILFSEIIKFCEGSGPLDTPSVDLVDITCAFLVTPPQRKRSDFPIYGSIPRWQQSIHVCASVPRVSVKEVSFVYKNAGAPSLSHLSIANAQPKRYASPKDKPIWAIENPGPGSYLSNIRSLWGIVAKEFGKSPSLWTFQKENLYLPAYRPGEETSRRRRLAEGDSMAASRGAMKVLKAIMSMSVPIGGARSPPPIIDPSFLDGSNNWKWQNMSSSPATLDRIPGLMWTTIAASAFVGTKSITSAIPSGRYKVQPLDPRIAYDPWWCGVPTVVGVVIWTLLICLTAYALASARASSSERNRPWHWSSKGGGRPTSAVRDSQDAESEALLNE